MHGRDTELKFAKIAKIELAITRRTSVEQLSRSALRNRIIDGTDREAQTRHLASFLAVACAFHVARTTL